MGIVHYIIGRMTARTAKRASMQHAMRQQQRQQREAQQREALAQQREERRALRTPYPFHF